MSISRAVALLTPVLAAAAGWVSMQAAQLPGSPHLDLGQLTAVFVAGASAAGAAGWKWLDGRAKWELTQAGLSHELTYYERGGVNEDGADEEPSPASDYSKEEYEKVRGQLGLSGLEAEFARLRSAFWAHDSRLDRLEAPKKPHGAGGVDHHPV